MRGLWRQGRQKLHFAACLFFEGACRACFPHAKQHPSPSCLRAVAERWKLDPTTGKHAYWSCGVHPCGYARARPAPYSEAPLLLFPMGTSQCEHSDHDALPWRYLQQFPLRRWGIQPSSRQFPKETSSRGSCRPLVEEPSVPLPCLLCFARFPCRILTLDFHAVCSRPCSLLAPIA